jgi:GMP synthase-like glutamine amidotransferase
VRALVIQQDHVSPIGAIGEGFSERGYDLVELNVVPEDRYNSPNVSLDLPDPLDFDAIIPMGAAWSVYDHDAIGNWINDELSFLRKAHDEGVPIFAICFGGQALATALGGSVVRASRPEVGWTAIESERPDLVPSGPWFQWHLDRWNLPASLSAFARTEVAEQAFTLGHSLGLQFHPELSPAMLNGWLENGGRHEAANLGFDPDALLAATSAEADAARERAHALVRMFLDTVATAPLMASAE